MSKLKEAIVSPLFPDQPIGYGKNSHSANTDPITWENISELDYFVTALPDGTFLAGISLPNSEQATATYKFNSEDDAMMWVRQSSESFRVKKANQEL
jgi:hypothetical protein